jgi:hypothetical protein
MLYVLVFVFVNSRSYVVRISVRLCKLSILCCTQGRIQDFKLGEAHLKKLHRAEGGGNIFGVFRVKNHDLTPKNHIFSNCEGGGKIVGVFRVKYHDLTPKNYIFSNFKRGGAPGAPPSGSAPGNKLLLIFFFY